MVHPDAVAPGRPGVLRCAVSETCTWCGSAAVVPVASGTPGADEVPRTSQGEPPDRRCGRCGHRWSTIDAVLAAHDGWDEVAGAAATLLPEPGRRAWAREAWRTLARAGHAGPDRPTQLAALALLHGEFSARAFGADRPAQPDAATTVAYPGVAAGLLAALGEGPLFAGLWLSGWPEMTYPLTAADVDAVLTVDPPGDQRVARYRRARFWVAEGMPRA